MGMPVRVKQNSGGEITKVKGRAVVADLVSVFKMSDVYSPNVGGDTARF